MVQLFDDLYTDFEKNFYCLKQCSDQVIDYDSLKLQIEYGY